MTENPTLQQFIEGIYAEAIDIKVFFDIAPIVTMTQAAHESNWGRSDLARLANNLFGVKSTPSWVKRGGKVWTGTTKEVVAIGSTVTTVDGFRAYDSWKDSCRDWAEIITRVPLYAEALVHARAGHVYDYARLVRAQYSPTTGARIRDGFAWDPDYEKWMLATEPEVRLFAARLHLPL